MKKTNQETGFTLIEVLVSLVIIAVGLMAIAALQYKALRYNNDSYIRTQINVLAFDLMDRMRLDVANNEANLSTYVNQISDGNDGAYIVPAGPIVGCVETTGLNNGTNNQVTCWLAQAQRALPPETSISLTEQDVDGNTVYSLIMGWDDKEAQRRWASFSFKI